MSRGEIVVALAFILTTTLHGRSVDQRTEILREWRDLVTRHHAGQLDTEALAVSKWPDDKIGVVGVDLSALLLKLRGRVPVQVQDPLLDLLEIKSNESLTRLLKRGAMLHTDAAMLAPQKDTATVEDDPLATDRAFRLSDGEHLGYQRLTRHWTLARTLLRNVRPDPSKDSMVHLWAIAVAAHMQDIRNFADAVPQLTWARELFPDDANLLFDTGAIHEWFASAEVQLPLKTLELRDSHVWIRASVRPAADEFRTAESLYRRALDVAPADAEILLRLGRVVGQLGRHEEAIALLKRAAAGLSVPALKYDVQLFLGREHQALGHLDLSRASFEEAARLFPRAQSPRLSLSQIAVLEGRTNDAEDALRAVLAASKGEDGTDPWEDYAFSHLRDLPALMRPVYAAVPAASGS